MALITSLFRLGLGYIPNHQNFWKTLSQPAVRTYIAAKCFPIFLLLSETLGTTCFEYELPLLWVKQPLRTGEMFADLWAEMVLPGPKGAAQTPEGTCPGPPSPL